MVSPTASRGPWVSERSEKNTSCTTLSERRSSRISAIIISMARSRTSGSHSASGLSRKLAP
jgi:hypothetical protein